MVAIPKNKMASTIEVPPLQDYTPAEGTLPTVPELRHPFFSGPDGVVTDGGYFARRLLRRLFGDVAIATYPLDPIEYDK